MDDNAEQQLMEMIKDCLMTARNLKEEYESLLQKQIEAEIFGRYCFDSYPSVETPLVVDADKRLNDIDLALESNQQQLKLALKQYLSIHSDLPTSEDSSTIQSDDNQKQIAQITIDQQVKLFDINNNKSQNEAKQNPTIQVQFTGTLPDDFYLHLMSVIGLQECLLSNRLVCSLWNDLVLERCANQKSLKVFETFKNLMNYGELLLEYEKTDDTSLILKSIGDDLLFEGLEIDHEQFVKSWNQDDDDDGNEDVDESDIQKEVSTRKEKLEASKILTNLFPRVEELVLCTKDHLFIESSINIEHLLQFYAEQLTSLTITDFAHGSDLLDFNYLKLKSLNLFWFSPEDVQLLSLLPQLESLTLPRSDISLEGLLRTGTQLRELSINEIRSVYTAPEDAVSKRLPINSNLRKFTFGSTKSELQALEFISRNLTSLECLKLYVACDGDIFRHLHSVTPYLVPLQQLHSLTLHAPVSFFLLDDNQVAEIQPLPSVRQLKLLLSGNASLPMDHFSRALFTAFPKVEQVLIAFVGNGPGGRVDSDTMAAFEDFASKHSNVVQLFRSKYMSRFTALPNSVSPLLGNHRQVYEEYIEEDELFGVPICKLAASLVPRQGEEAPNLKSILRPADRLSAMANLFQLLESGAFTFLDFPTHNNFWVAETMIRCMVECSLKYGPSQFALFKVTSMCVLSLLGCNAFKVNPAYILERTLQLAVHYGTQQFKDADLLLQMHQSMDKPIQTMFNKSQFKCVINQFMVKDPVYRVEMARALLRVCSSTKNCFRSN